MNTRFRSMILFAVAALATVVLAGCINVQIQGTDSGGSSSASSSSASTTSDTGADSSGGQDSSSSSSNSSSSSDSSSDSSPSPSSSTTDTTSNANLVKVGKPSTGYVMVPKTWKDYTYTVDSRQAEASDLTYVADPDTEYTSAITSHFEFAGSIKLETYPCLYTEKADEVYINVKGENYSDSNISKEQVGGFNASIVTAVSAENVQVSYVVIEKDASSCILISLTSTPSNLEEILSYLATWSLD